MIIIHQPKSAGSSLTIALSQVLNVPLYIPPKSPPPKTQRNCHPEEFIEDLVRYASASTPIRSTHAHPTSDLMKAFSETGIPAVVLLRNPVDSFEAMKRHRGIDNKNRGSHQVLRRARQNALAQMEEYHNNWRTLVGSPSLLFISFEQVVNFPSETIGKIAGFYGIEITNIVSELPRARYTGVGGKNTTDLTKTNCSTFQFNPYSWRKRQQRLFVQKVIFFNTRFLGKRI